MKSEDLRKTTDEMASKIFDYIEMAEPDDDEKDKRYIELACSFVNATINCDDDIETIAHQIYEACFNISNMVMGGALRLKSGDMSRVVSEHFRGDDKCQYCLSKRNGMT